MVVTAEMVGAEEAAVREGQEGRVVMGAAEHSGDAMGTAVMEDPAQRAEMRGSAETEGTVEMLVPAE
jgi:hypothetical protein